MAESGLADIVVTATRRTENIQKAPAAIVAVEGASLTERGVTTLAGLNAFVPSARFTMSGGQVVQVNIRGVGQSIDAPYIPEPVSTNYNDVYIPRVATGSAPLYDVARVEVLPGPQGTLYGKGAIGGVVNITNNAPTESLGLELTGEFGNYGLAHETAVINAPLGPDLAVRLAGDIQDRGAYFSNGMDNLHARSTRLSLLYTPTDNVSLLLWGSYTHRKYNPQPTNYVLPTVNKDPYDQPGADPVTGLDFDQLFAVDELIVLGGKLDFKLGPVDLTYVPSYLAFNSRSSTSVAGLPVTGRFRPRQTTHELRLSADLTDRLSILGSVYYYHNDTFQLASVAGDALGSRLNAVSEGISQSGQIRYEVTDGIRLTAATRYSHDTMTPKNAVSFAGGFALPFLFPEKKKWDNVDWKVEAEVDVGPQSMVYGNIQTAYQPGGYQTFALTSGVKLEEENILGFTMGMKNRFLNNTLQINTEAFLYEYKNLIIATLQNGVIDNFSVPKSRVYGNQLDLAYSPNRLVRAYVSVGLLSAKIRELAISPAPGLPAVSYKGKKLPNAPKTNITFGVEHGFELGDGSRITINADSSYNSGYYQVYDNANGLKQKSFTKTDASVTYSPSSGAWSLTAFVRNIEDQETFESGLVTPYAAVLPDFGRAVYFGPPRTYGVRLHVMFGNP